MAHSEALRPGIDYGRVLRMLAGVGVAAGVVVVGYYVLQEGKEIMQAMGKESFPGRVPDPREGMLPGYIPVSAAADELESFPITDGRFQGGIYATPIYETTPGDLINTNEIVPQVDVIPRGAASPKDMQEIIAVAQSGFGKHMTPEDVIQHVNSGEVRVVRNASGQIVAFAISQETSTENALGVDGAGKDRSYYLAGRAVHADYQNKGLASMLLDQQLQDFKAGGHDRLVVRTQNHLIEQTIISRLRELQATGQISGFDVEQRMVMPGFYGRQLADGMTTPPPGSAYGQINLARGDAYGIVFKIR